MKSINKWLPILAFGLGFLMIYGGSELAIPLLVHASLLPIGLAVIIWGADAIITRRSSYTIGEDNQREETYTGFAAIADGVVLVAIGFAIISAGAVLLLGFEDVMLGYLQARPGIALMFGGGLAAVYGLTLVLGTQQENRAGLRALASIPGRIFGLILLVAGIGAALIGIAEMLAPDIYLAAVQFMKNLLPTPPDFDL